MNEFIHKLVALKSTQANRVAIISDGQRLAFGDLPSLAMAAAGWLAARGVRSGDVVAISLTNEVEHLVLSLGLLAMGAWQVNAASHDSAATRADLAARTGASFHLTDSDEWAIPGLARLDRKGDLTFEGAASVLPSGGGGGFFSTSGTTGRQSIVRMSETAMVAQARRGYTGPDDRLYKGATLEFGHAKRNRLFALWTGSQNVFRTSKDGQRLSVWLSQSGATIADVSRVTLTGMLSDPEGGLPADLMLRAEGSVIPSTLREQVMRKVTRNFHVRYASTETGLIALAGPQDHLTEGALGLPCPDVGLSIRSADGAPVAAGEVGEIWLRTPGMAQGYFDDPAKTAERFSDGWFRPGDLGYVSPNGQLVMVGRKDDVINMNGIKIFPIEIERVLASHPDVTAVAVLPIASKVHGHIPVAALELRAGAMDRQDAIIDDLMTIARTTLGIRAPRKLIACEILPRNAMGKIVTRDLLSKFETNR